MWFAIKYIIKIYIYLYININICCIEKKYKYIIIGKITVFKHNNNKETSYVTISYQIDFCSKKFTTKL